MICFDKQKLEANFFIAPYPKSRPLLDREKYTLGKSLRSIPGYFFLSVQISNRYHGFHIAIFSKYLCVVEGPNPIGPNKAQTLESLSVLKNLGKYGVFS